MLRSGHFSQLDITHLVEKIRDPGKRERTGLGKPFGGADGAPAQMALSARLSESEILARDYQYQRRGITRLLDENPNLRGELGKVIAQAYPDALDVAVAETPFDYEAFPESCPWDERQILKNHWPTADEVNCPC